MKYLGLLIALTLTTHAISQVEKKVIIEHYTNTKCGVCANKNTVFYQLLEDYPQVLHIAYHPSSPYASCVFNQHNPQQNDDRAYHYNVYGATPRAVIQGDVLPIQSPMVKAEDIESRLGTFSDYKLTISNSEVTGSDFKVKYTIEKVSGSSEEIILYVGLAEEEVNYNAPNGENLHHDVFRERLHEGNVLLSSVGETETNELNYSMDPEWQTEQIFAYIVVQNATTNEVLQAESTLTSISSIPVNTASNSDITIFPNPASSKIQINSKDLELFHRIELYSLFGNKVKEFDINSEMDISDINEGIYYVRVTTKDNQIISSKIIKAN